MPTFRDTTQRRRVSRALLSLLGHPELSAATDPVPAARQLVGEALTGSERWLLELALWIDEDAGDAPSPDLAGWDRLDPARQHAVATLLAALAEDGLAYDQDPAQGGAAVDLWLAEHGG